MEVNYRWKKHYKTAKYPIRQPKWLTWLIWFLSKCALIGKKYKLETIDMEGLEPPYIIFSNHMAFIDFELSALVTYPQRVNNVVNIDEQPELASRYRIMTIPTLMVLKDGNIVEQSVGAKPKHQILAMV